MRPFHPPTRPRRSLHDRLRHVALLAATGLVLGACESSLDVGTVSRVEVTADRATIAVGETTVLTATAFDSDGEPAAFSGFTWSTNGGNLRTTGESRHRELEGTEPGTVTVTATFVGVEGSITIDVVAGGAGG